MKRTVLLLIASVVFSLSAGAQIVSSHYYDIYGAPYFRVDVLKSSQSSGDPEQFFPSERGDHGMGVNVSLGYYIPLFRSNFFYAPEIALTARLGNDKANSEDKYYASYFGLGLKAVPLQFGYSFEVSPSFTINPKIGAGVTYLPLGSRSYHGEGNTEKGKWEGTVNPVELIGCDFVLREKNLILSVILESGEYVQADVGLGVLF